VLIWAEARGNDASPVTRTCRPCGRTADFSTFSKPSFRIAAAFAVGAAGVQIGSAYLRCPESKVIAPARAALA
jgi:hypothetical protein